MTHKTEHHSISVSMIDCSWHIVCGLYALCVSHLAVMCQSHYSHVMVTWLSLFHRHPWGIQWDH